MCLRHGHYGSALLLSEALRAIPSSYLLAILNAFIFVHFVTYLAMHTTVATYL